MFRNISEDGNGHINNGFKPNDDVHTNIEPAKMTISRSVYDQRNLHNEMIYNKDSKSPSSEGFAARSSGSFFLRTFPFLSWIYNYKREDLVGKLINRIILILIK